MQIAAQGHRIDIVGLDLQDCAVVGNRALWIVFTAIRVGSVEKCLRVFWIELDDLAVVGDGAVELTGILVGHRAVVVRQRVIAIELDRAAVVGDGFVELAQVVIGHAAVVIGVGLIGHELDRGGVVLHRELVVTLVAIGNTPIVMGGGKVRLRQLARRDGAGAGANVLVDVSGALGTGPCVVDGVGPCRQRQTDDDECKSESNHSESHSWRSLPWRPVVRIGAFKMVRLRRQWKGQFHCHDGGLPRAQDFDRLRARDAMDSYLIKF